MRALEASKKADLELLISTCIIKDRVFTQEFEDLCNFCKEGDIPLYVTLAKPVGTMREQDTWVCTKKDVDYLKLLENKYNIFTSIFCAIHIYIFICRKLSLELLLLSY
jgi:molybdenum cofactor biosynthesis enzyme MoaA